MDDTSDSEFFFLQLWFYSSFFKTMKPKNIFQLFSFIFLHISPWICVGIH